MTKEEAIKFLHQLYPNGGHCWLDEQRMEAISMAINALQEEPAPKIFEDMLNAKTPTESLGISAEEHEKIIDLCLYGKEPEMVDVDDLPKEEPVSEDLEKTSKEYADKNYAEWLDFVSGDERDDHYPISEAFKAGAQWQKTKDESTTEDLDEYINELSKQFPEVSFAKLSRIAVRIAKWQKEHLLKPADGDDLPEIDREVIVLTQPYPLENSEYAVSFAHRPNPDGWDGKSLSTGKVEHYTPKTYDKGGWNIPDVKYWFNVELPKEIEL